MRLPSSKKPLFVRTIVCTEWATASPNSFSAAVLRLVMSSQAWW